MSDNLPDRSDQRASDADREAVVEKLRTAASDGRLDLAEFEERMTQTYAARTFGELAPMTADLGGHAPARRESAADEVTFRGAGSSFRRTGRWEVPRRIVVDRQMGATLLDLTEAKLLSTDVEIELRTSAGSVRIILPDRTAVDVNDLQTDFGHVRLRVSEPEHPDLRVRITGRATMGSVIVTGPTWLARRRMRKRRAG